MVQRFRNIDLTQTFEMELCFRIGTYAFLERGGLIMNNLLIQLAERDYREETLLKSRNIQGKKVRYKSVWNLMHILPAIPGIELFYNRQMLKNESV